MSEIGEMYKAKKEYSQVKRSANRNSAPKILAENGIMHDIKNMGAHIIVEGRIGKIDFWPGTGKYITRRGSKGRGIYNLMKLCHTNK